MRRFLQTGLLLFLCALFIKSEAQTDQTVGNGAKTGPFTFPGPDCTYKWTNNNPSIGLPANGTGNIPSFAAINNSNGPVTGTITATPSSLNGFAYITNSSGKSVSVIDITTDKVVATIQVGDNPAGVAISPDGTRVYVTNQGTPSVSVINALTNQVIANISMPLNSDPSGIVISPDGATLYICAFNQNTVFVVNTVSNTITANITVGANPWQMAISSDGKLLYVASPSSNNISVVNTSSNAVIATVPLSLPPTGMALSPDGSKLYTENYNSNTVSIISTSNFTVIGTATVGANPVAAAVTPDGARIYVSNGYDNTVSVVNAANNATIATIPVGVTVGMIGVSRDGSKVYAIIVSEGKVVVISTKTNSVIATVPVGLGPESLGNFVGGCPAVTFKITVNSGPTPVVTTSTITGNIIGCVGSPGESPNVGKFTVAGTSLSGDITVTPPPGFDLSLTAIGGYSTSLTLKQIGGTVISVPIYIRSSPADPVGPISGNIQLTTPGATADVVPVTGVVNALPTVNTVQNVPYNNGAMTTPVVFTGSADSFDWINDQPAIGLPASGAGSIPSFSATNNGNAPLVAMITVTPKSNTTGCPGTPVTFTITVNSLFPSITTGPVSGTISACVGSASASPNIQQFKVSGSSLTGDIIATAPTGFEVSLSQGSGFGNTLTIPQSAGIVSNVTVYVRSAATDPAGSISGNVALSSPGAPSQNVAVSGTVNALPTVNAVTNQTKNNGAATEVINFTGTGADTYNWTNDVPGIGLPASGTGNIPSFNAIDVNGDTPVTATLTVTPVNTLTGCTGTPVTFTITVNPASPPVISPSGTLTGLSTIYGTASSSESFTVSASNATAGILVTAPQGFEVSTDNQTFSPTVIAGQAGAITNVPVYIRLAATSPVNNYSGDMVLSTAGATDVNVNMPLSAVNRVVLTVTAPDVTRAFGVPNPVFVPQYLGFVNGENQSVLAILPQLTTIATPSSAVGQYPIHVSGGSALNYTIFPVDGTLTIVPSPSEIIVPNAFTPNGDGVNDFWNIKALVDFPQCIVSIYSRYGNLVFQSRGYGKPWDGTQNGAPVPTGTYYYVIDPNEAGLQLLSSYVAVLR